MIDLKRDIRNGTILKVNPGSGSHSKESYKVVIVSIDARGFNTELFGKAPDTGILPHNRRFNYDSPEWESYHKQRFEIA